MNLHKALLEEYIAHYQFEKERISRAMALKDEVERKSMAIVLEMIDFEILEAQEEIDLLIANQHTL